VHRTSEVDRQALLPSPPDIHAVEQILHEAARPAVDDEADASLLIVLYQEYHAPVKEGILHLGHGQKKKRRFQAGDI